MTQNGQIKQSITADFDAHPIWGNIETVTIDGQSMVKIPKFYYKVGTASSGDQSGKKCWWISATMRDGYTLHPAFMQDVQEIDYFYVGAYEASNDSGTKAASVSGVAPLVSIDFTTMQTRCEARGTGWRMWDIYQLGAIQMLALIELETPDVQSAIGAGNVSSSGIVECGLERDI